MNALAAALALGVPCFPCSANKRPAIPGPGGHNHATDDRAALCVLWRRYPGPLVGVPTGEASGLSVLDADTARHPEATAWLDAHRTRLPTTRVHQTISGGLHLVFQHAPGVRNSQNRLAPGIDTRGEGGYAIWWPATGCPVLCDAPPAPWPDWLLEALLRRATALGAAAVSGPATPLDHRRLEGLLRKLAFAPEGQRNGLLYWSACRLGEAIGKGEIAPDIGEAVLLRAALRAGLPKDEARRTIASGFKTTART